MLRKENQKMLCQSYLLPNFFHHHRPHDHLSPSWPLLLLTLSPQLDHNRCSIASPQQKFSHRSLLKETIRSLVLLGHDQHCHQWQANRHQVKVAHHPALRRNGIVRCPVLAAALDLLA